MKPLLLITLPLLALVGCQTLEQEIVLPGVDESPPAVLLGHVPGGLPADLYEDAAEVTGEAVLRYVALSDQVTPGSSGGGYRGSWSPLHHGIQFSAPHSARSKLLASAGGRHPPGMFWNEKNPRRRNH